MFEALFLVCPDIAFLNGAFSMLVFVLDETAAGALRLFVGHLHTRDSHNFCVPFRKTLHFLRQIARVFFLALAFFSGLGGRL